MNIPGSTASIAFRRIGAGFCGSVWAPPTSTTTLGNFLETDDYFALKREDGGPESSLQNDYEIHLRILESWKAFPATVQLPKCFLLLAADDEEFWAKHSCKSPKGYTPCPTLLSERIQPFPALIREGLVARYCPQSLQTSINKSEENQDCIVRCYLGRRRRRANNSRLKAFSLRNFPLHLDQMEELQLDTSAYARVMAEALAIMHWIAKIDANDVEFVLAPPRKGIQSFSSLNLGPHSMWILDFDCCRSITMDQTGVEKAAAAYWKNDPYFPRPGKSSPEDQELWTAFKEQFLRTSENILGSDCIARLLMERIEAGTMLTNQSN